MKFGPQEPVLGSRCPRAAIGVRHEEPSDRPHIFTCQTLDIGRCSQLALSVCAVRAADHCNRMADECDEEWTSPDSL